MSTLKLSQMRRLIFLQNENPPNRFGLAEFDDDLDATGLAEFCGNEGKMVDRAVTCSIGDG